jgi:hypothetical protein
LPPPAASASPIVSTAPTTTPLSSLEAAPAGAWTRLDWIAAGFVLPPGHTNVGLLGWSGGFLAVAASGGHTGDDTSNAPFAIASAASSDGLHWSAWRNLDVSKLGDGVDVDGIVEGPSGLLLVGRPFGDTCGGPETVAALWSSTDGATWKRVPLPSVWRSNRVQSLDGGSSGYVATGLLSDGTTPGIWLSQDGATWHTAALPKLTSGKLVVDGATSFAGGLVVVGAVLGEEGCGGAASVHPSIWWSADGVRWTREALAGASTASDASMRVERLTDGTIAAFVETSTTTPGLQAWISTDGRAWTAVSSPEDFAAYGLVGDGRHAAAIIEPDSGTGAPTVYAIDENLSATTLTQAGDGPVASPDSGGWSFAVGPTGIVLLGSDGRVWIGVPGAS